MNTKREKLIGKIQKKKNRYIKNPKPEKKANWNDLLTFSSAIVGILVTAIIYFEGWVYAASWYGFYNIDMAQIGLATPTILIDGVPTIAIALFILGVSILITMIANRIFHRHPLSRSDIPLQAFLSVVLFALFIFILQKYLYPIILLETYVLNGVTKYKYGMVQNSNVTSLVFSNAAIYAVLILVLFILLFLILAQLVAKKTRDLLPPLSRKSSLVIYDRLRQLSQVWQIGGSILVLVYLIMPLIISSEIGRIDALRGRHLVSGSHLLPSVEIQSDSPIPALEKMEIKSGISGEYDYGPLLLVYSDSNNYYLVDNIPGQTYYDSPNTYYVQRTSNNHVVLILNPKISGTTEIINGILTPNKPLPAAPTPTPSLP